jgi:hypothetical protein
MTISSHNAHIKAFPLSAEELMLENYNLLWKFPISPKCGTHILYLSWHL